jgi:hypothetical protein
VPLRPPLCGHPHSFHHLALSLAAGLPYLGSFRNLHCNRETAAERATRQSPHDLVAAGVSSHSVNATLAGRLRSVSQPEAMRVPFAPSPPPPSPLDPSFGASPVRLGSFRNLHCGQEAGGGNPRYQFP